MRKLYSWNEKVYGVLFDGDAQALYYRKDAVHEEGEPGQVQGEIQLRPSRAAEDDQGISRRRGLLHRLGLERRRPERLGHFAARQSQRAGLLPLPDALGAVRGLAGQQVLLLQSRHDEAADQLGGPRQGARGLCEVPRQRSEGGDQLDARPGLEPVPRRAFGDGADLGRPADARAGPEDLEGQGQDGRGAAARHDGGLQPDHRPMEEVRPQPGRQHQRRHLALRDLAPVEEAGGDLRLPRLHGEQEERLVQLHDRAGPACSPA